MSVFASETKKTVQIGDLAVIIRKLSGKSLRKAKEVRQIAQMSMSRQMGGELVKAFHETAAAKDAVRPSPTIEEQRRARYTDYDIDDVLVRGIESWSAPRPVSEGIEDLDDQVGQQIFEEIIDLSLGPIDPAKVAEGKG